MEPEGLVLSDWAGGGGGGGAPGSRVGTKAGSEQQSSPHQRHRVGGKSTNNRPKGKKRVQVAESPPQAEPGSRSSVKFCSPGTGGQKAAAYERSKFNGFHRKLKAVLSSFDKMKKKKIKSSSEFKTIRMKIGGKLSAAKFVWVLQIIPDLVDLTCGTKVNQVNTWISFGL